MTNQQGAPEALRLRHYVERRKRATQLDVNKVHAFDAGCGSEAELLLSDIETLLSLVEAQQPAPSAGAEHAETMRRIGEGQAFEAWFKVDCPVEGVNARIAAKAAWQARAALDAPQPSPTPQADSQSAPTNTRQIAECYGDCPTDPKTCANPCKFEGRAARAPADSVLEDAAREAIEKVLALFPFNVPIQKFIVNNGPCLTADNDDEFYSVKRVLAFLTEIKTTLDAARKQGGA